MDQKPNLPEQIRSLSDGIQPDAPDDSFMRGYRFGHRDARHAAAELAAAALSAPPAQEPVAYIDPIKFAELRRFTDRGGVLTTITPHRAFPHDVPLYASPLPQKVTWRCPDCCGLGCATCNDSGALPQEPQEGKALTDERVYELAKEHFGGCGHDLIWQDDPRYAAACDMPKDARWSTSTVRAEQTLAFARGIERELRGAQEGKAGERNV